MVKNKSDTENLDNLSYSEQALRAIFYQLQSIHYILDLMLILAVLGVIISFII